tara:strand:+ start:461 stop:1087 length:627 start_codon:yes stop_codon:yes gene_type:complete
MTTLAENLLNLRGARNQETQLCHAPSVRSAVRVHMPGVVRLQLHLAHVALENGGMIGDESYVGSGQQLTNCVSVNAGRCAAGSQAQQIAPDTTTEICDGGVGETLRLVPGDPAIGRLLVALPREKHLLGNRKFFASPATQRCLFQYQMSARRARFTSQRLNLIYIGIAPLRCDFQPAISVLGNQPAIVLKSPHRQPCLPLRCFRCRPS